MDSTTQTRIPVPARDYSREELKELLKHRRIDVDAFLKKLDLYLAIFRDKQKTNPELRFLKREDEPVLADWMNGFLVDGRRMEFESQKSKGYYDPILGQLVAYHLGFETTDELLQRRIGGTRKDESLFVANAIDYKMEREEYREKVDSEARLMPIEAKGISRWLHNFRAHAREALEKGLPSFITYSKERAHFLVDFLELENIDELLFGDRKHTYFPQKTFTAPIKSLSDWSFLPPVNGNGHSYRLNVESHENETEVTALAKEWARTTRILNELPSYLEEDLGQMITIGLWKADALVQKHPIAAESRDEIRGCYAELEIRRGLREFDGNIPFSLDACDLSEIPYLEQTPEEVLIAEAKREILHQRLNRLPTKYWNALRLRFSEGKTLEEIGGSFDMTREGARQCIEKGITRLGEYLNPNPFQDHGKSVDPNWEKSVVFNR